MNRSRRRATVICWVIAAGALYGGTGTAWADPASAGEATGNAPAGAKDSDPGQAASPRRSHRRVVVTAQPDTSPAGLREPRGSGRTQPPEEGVPEHWPCPWPFIVPIPPPQPAAWDPRGWTPAQFPMAIANPFAQPVISVTPALTAFDAAADVPPVVSAPAPAAQAATAPAPAGPAPARVPDPGRSARSGSLPPAAPPSAPPRLSAPEPPMTAGPVATPESVRSGYPEYLRGADLPRLASAALPGLAAIAGMTALGGFLGYRQARAGYLLRTAGAGRFLQ